jgi:hypothetical protein
VRDLNRRYAPRKVSFSLPSLRVDSLSLGLLKEISERSRQKLDAVKRYYEKNGLLPEVKAGILSEKTLNFLLEKADVKYL